MSVMGCRDEVMCVSFRDHHSVHCNTLQISVLCLQLRDSTLPFVQGKFRLGIHHAHKGWAVPGLPDPPTRPRGKEVHREGVVSQRTGQRRGSHDQVGLFVQKSNVMWKSCFVEVKPSCLGLWRGSWHSGRLGGAPRPCPIL